ncbi:MAG: hypothetical protein PHT07_23815 [Paludibacter sp.]|nr:hypothetical protein [Paludibacter sp.]
MKYENYPQAKALVKEIDGVQEIIDSLNTQDNINFEILSKHIIILDISTGKEPEHECYKIAVEFLDKLKQFYASKMNRLLIQLEKL